VNEAVPYVTGALAFAGVTSEDAALASGRSLSWSSRRPTRAVLRARAGGTLALPSTVAGFAGKVIGTGFPPCPLPPAAAVQSALSATKNPPVLV
jgi:hypothetical protein